jgi:hypothetical protein
MLFENLGDHFVIAANMLGVVAAAALDESPDL